MPNTSHELVIVVILEGNNIFPLTLCIILSNGYALTTLFRPKYLVNETQVSFWPMGTVKNY